MWDFDWDIKLNINHLVYIFVASLSWLGLSIWGDHQLNTFYLVIPLSEDLIKSMKFTTSGI